MRYSDRGKMTDAEAAELRRRFLATVERAESRGAWHFTPPRHARRPRRNVPRSVKVAIGVVLLLVVALLLTACPGKARPARHPGQFCDEPGSTATSPEGQLLVCTRDPHGARWRVDS